MISQLKLNLYRLCPISPWAEDLDGEKWSDGTPMYLIDGLTGDRYLNQTESSKRGKCALLVVGGPLVNALFVTGLVVKRIFSLLFFYHFWKTVPEEEGLYNLKQRCIDVAKDCVRILVSPLALIFLELAAIEGLFSPHNGSKVYVNMEMAFYGHVFANCFGIDPDGHVFGGSIKDRDAW